MENLKLDKKNLAFNLTSEPTTGGMVGFTHTGRQSTYLELITAINIVKVTRKRREGDKWVPVAAGVNQTNLWGQGCEMDGWLNVHMTKAAQVVSTQWSENNKIISSRMKLYQTVFISTRVCTVDIGESSLCWESCRSCGLGLISSLWLSSDLHASVNIITLISWSLCKHTLPRDNNLAFKYKLVSLNWDI